MGKPTEKMVFRLLNSGYKQADVDLMSYEMASSIIGKLPAYHKEVKSPQVEHTEEIGWKVDKSQVYKPKPTYNPSSQYVSYSKDIYLMLRGYLQAETKGVGVEDAMVMKKAIELIKQAIKEFE